jgi:hypothetical protein
LKWDNNYGVMEEGGVSHQEKGAAMAARVQRRDGVRPVTTPALLQTEVEDEAGTVGRLGQAGCIARWDRVVLVWAGQ